MSADSQAPSPPVRRPVPWVPLTLLLLLLGFALFGEKGILRAMQASRQKLSLEKELRQVEATNAALRQEIEALRSDHRTIEGIARKELGMVREDELVYQFRTPDKGAQPAVGPAAGR